MTLSPNELEKLVLAQEDYIIGLRRHFHQHPEPSLKEYETIARVKEELDAIGIPYVSVGETGALATLVGKKGAGKTLFIRADIDALELQDQSGTEYASLVDSLNHACGHDAHTASLLAAAKILKGLEDQLSGSVKFGFQQAEEIGAGAKQFVAAGHLDDVDEVFAIHVSSAYPLGTVSCTPGPNNASCDIFTIRVHGKSGHVGQPHVARDALVAAAAIVVELQTIVAREISPIDPAVVGIGRLDAGTRYNIVASEALIEGTVRAFSHETRAHLLEAVERIADLVAKSHRTTIDFDVYDAAAPVINSEAPTARVAGLAASIPSVNEVISNKPLSLGADDFADYLSVCPGTYSQVGTQSSEATAFAHHHQQFDIDEKGLLIVTQLHVANVLDFLS